MTESPDDGARSLLEAALVAAGLPAGDVTGLAEEYRAARAGCDALRGVPLSLVAEDRPRWPR